MQHISPIRLLPARAERPQYSPYGTSTRALSTTACRGQNRTRLEHPGRVLPPPEEQLVHMVDVLFKLRRQKGSTVEDLRSRVMDTSEGLLGAFTDCERVRTQATLMANTMNPWRAYRYLMLARDLGCKLKPSVFESVVHRLAKTKQWSEIPRIVGLAKKSCKFTSRLLNWRALASLQCARFGHVEGVLDAFREAGLQPNRRTYHILLSGHLKNRNLLGARDCLKAMVEAGFPADQSTHAIIVSSYRSLGPDREVRVAAMQALPHLSGAEATTATLNSLLQLVLDSGDVESALHYLSFFNGPEAAIVRGAYSGGSTTLRDGALEDESPSLPPHQTPFPDAATFTMIINFLVKERNYTLAMEMLNRMKSSCIPPDSRLAAAVIRLLCSAGDLVTALHLTADMFHDLPDAQPIFAWLGLGLPYRLDLLPSGIPLTTEILNALLAGVLAQRGPIAMRVIYRLMRIAELTPDAHTVTIFLTHLHRAERIHPTHLIRVLRQLSKVVPPTLDHIHVIFSAIHDNSSARVRRRGWWSLRRKALSAQRPAVPIPMEEPETVPYDPIAGTTSLQKRHRSLLRAVIQSIRDRGLRATRQTFHQRMREEIILRGDVHRARNHLTEMLGRGMHAGGHHMAELMQGHALAGDMEAAEGVLVSMSDEAVKPNVVHHTILIAGYARLGQPGKALAAFRRMISVGVRPDVASIDALASGWFASGAVNVARHVLIRLWPYVGAFPDDLRHADTHTLAMEFRKLDPLSNTSKEQQRRMARWHLARLGDVWDSSKSLQRRWPSKLRRIRASERRARQAAAARGERAAAMRRRAEAEDQMARRPSFAEYLRQRMHAQ